MKKYEIVVLLTIARLTSISGEWQLASRNLLSQNNMAALSLLTKEMSDMNYFKSTLLRPMMIERVSDTDGNKAVQKHIKFLLRSWHIVEDKFTDSTPYGKKEFTNIIATFDPSKPTKIVLACHFDSKYMPNEKFIGATDSAVPCGILLETARQLQCLLEKGAKPDSPASKLTLQLIFFDGEEAFQQWTSTDSIYGARHLATKWSVEPDPANNTITKIQAIGLFILLDLLGTAGSSIPLQFSQTSNFYQDLVSVEQYLRANNYLVGGYPSPIFVGQNSWIYGGIEDDHLPFMQKGVPILHLISYPFSEVWHKSTDDWDHLDFDFINDFCRIFRVFVSGLLHLQPENRGCRKK